METNEMFSQPRNLEKQQAHPFSLCHESMENLKRTALCSKCIGWKPYWSHGSASHMEPE